jgi:hypothetical protein
MVITSDGGPHVLVLLTQAPGLLLHSPRGHHHKSHIPCPLLSIAKLHHQEWTTLFTEFRVSHHCPVLSIAELNHQKWILDVNELQDCKVSFPVVADDRAEVAKKVGLG